MNQSISVIKTFAACFTMIALAAYAGGAFGQDMERSFSVDEGDRVVVDVERAELNIVAWDRSEVSISVQHAERYEFDFSQEDGVVTIHGEYDRPNFLFGFSNRRSAIVTMNVPYRQNLDLQTSGGDIGIDRLQGEFAARTSGGDIEAGAVDGPVDARTSGGSIRLESSNGDVDAVTSGGAIRLNQVAGEVFAKTSGGRIRIGDAGASVEARTSGGSIDIESAAGAVQARTSGGSVEVGFAGQPDGYSELRTSGGSVTAYLHDDVRANLSASTSGGRVTSDFPEISPENSGGRGKLEQALNGGGPELELRTSGGSVRIMRHEN